MNRYWVLVVGVCLLFFLACESDKATSKVPEIRLDAFGPGQIRQGATDQALLIRLWVKDRDADLIADGSSPSLYLKDLRFPANQPVGYVLPQIGSVFLDANVGFEGNIELPIPGTRLLFRDEDTARKRDTLQYEIYLTDRAGNVSNTVRTESVYILK